VIVYHKPILNLITGDGIASAPYPSKGIINIESKDYDEIVSVTISNIFGHTMYSKRTNIVQSIDLTNNQTGVYFAEFIFKNGQRQVISLILD